MRKYIFIMINKLSVSALSLLGLAAVVPGFVGGCLALCGLLVGACWLLDQCSAEK